MDESVPHAVAWLMQRREVNRMKINDALRAIGGFFVLLSLALGHWVDERWYLFTAFVGLNLLQSGFTRWCPMMWFLETLGMEW